MVDLMKCCPVCGHQWYEHNESGCFVAEVNPAYVVGSTTEPKYVQCTCKEPVPKPTD